MTSDDIDRARRNYESSSQKVGKVHYLNGNGPEKQACLDFNRWALMNNSDPTRPHVMTLKKKYRRG